MLECNLTMPAEYYVLLEKYHVLKEAADKAGVIIQVSEDLKDPYLLSL